MNVISGIETNPDIVACADVNGDNRVDIADVVAIMKMMGGIDTGDKENAYQNCPDDHHPHWIDLGIGTQWSCCNVGASTLAALIISLAIQGKIPRL